MSENDPGNLTDAVKDAQEAFRHASGAPEEGLGGESDTAVLQLKKACRLLEAGRTLRQQNGYHTAIVELSFGAIERSFEFYALAHSSDTIGDFMDHTYAYDRAFELGVISANLRDDYRSLYDENRTESYYGDRQVTEQEATAMFRLAEDTHEFLREHPRDHYNCLCG
jgi:hypothetical protein